MKLRLIFFFLLIVMISSCASTKEQIRKDEDTQLYTVKVVNSSIDKVALRYENDERSFTFRFVDTNSEIKFLMNGELTIQYSLKDYDDAKIFKIKQDTFIHVLENDIIVDDLPPAEKIKPSGKTEPQKKVLEKTK